MSKDETLNRRRDWLIHDGSLLEFDASRLMKHILRFLVHTLYLPRVPRRKVEDYQFLGLRRAPEQPSLTGSEVVTPRRLVLIGIEKRRFAKEKVRAARQ